MKERTAEITKKYVGTEAIINTVKSILEKEPTEKSIDLCLKILQERKNILWVNVKIKTGGGSAYPLWNFKDGEKYQKESYEIFLKEVNK